MEEVKEVKTRKPRKTYSEDTIKFVTENAAALKDKDIAEKLALKVSDIRGLRKKLNIIKSPGRGVCRVKKEDEVVAPTNNA